MQTCDRWSCSEWNSTETARQVKAIKNIGSPRGGLGLGVLRAGLARLCLGGGGRRDVPAALYGMARGNDCHSTQRLAWGIQWKAYSDTPCKVYQGDLLDILMAPANGAPTTG